MEADMGGSTPVEGGAVEVSATVTIVYRINQ